MYHLARQTLENLLVYFEPLLPFANSHMVNFFTDDLYKIIVPSELRKEIAAVGHEDILNLILHNNVNQNTPELEKFISAASQFYLYNLEDVCLTSQQLYEKFREAGYVSLVPAPKLQIFMTSKKSHEVEMLSAVAAALKYIGNTSHVIDVGDGRGYLSSLLALHYKIPVLGVDSSVTNTNSASKRVGKLQRVWKGIKTAPKKSVPKHNEDTQEKSDHLYKQITLFVDHTTNFNDLISSEFSQQPANLSLTGLHTCGELASTCVHMYATNDDIKTLCNVSCCYHLITESFELKTSNRTISHNFPMSELLRGRKFALGRCARMLASQSVDRLLHRKTVNVRSIFFRALYQVFLEVNCGDVRAERVGRLKREYDDFLDYVHEVSDKIGVKIRLSDEDIRALYECYRDREAELNVFYLLRCTIAPVIESLVLLDRLLFLLEKGFRNSYLVQVFDPVISPRCYGVVSYKS